MQNRKSKLIFPCFQPPLWTTCRRRQTSMLSWDIFWSTIQVNSVSWSRAEQPNRSLRLSFISWPNNEDFKLFKAVANTTEQTLKVNRRSLTRACLRTWRRWMFRGIPNSLRENNVSRFQRENSTFQNESTKCLVLFYFAGSHSVCLIWRT